MKKCLFGLIFLMALTRVYGQSRQHWNAVFSFPDAYLDCSQEMKRLRIDHSYDLTQSAFFKFQTTHKSFRPDTVFIGPLVRDQAFEPDVRPFMNLSFEFAPTVNILRNDGGKYSFPVGPYWRRVGYQMPFFSCRLYQVAMEGIVVGRYQYFMINPRAIGRRNALIPINVVVVQVTEFTEVSPVEGQ